MKKIMLTFILGMVLMLSGSVYGQDYFGDIYFVQQEDLTTFEVWGRHDEMACCYEMYFMPEEAEKIINYTAVPPLDLFQNWNMSYRVIDHPNSSFIGCGQAIGGYGLGEMNESFHGVLGYLYTTEPIELSLGDCNPDDNYDPFMWWDGIIPNYPRLTNSWVEYYEDNQCSIQTRRTPMSLGDINVP